MKFCLMTNLTQLQKYELELESLKKEKDSIKIKIKLLRNLIEDLKKR